MISGTATMQRRRLAHKQVLAAVAAPEHIWTADQSCTTAKYILRKAITQDTTANYKTQQRWLLPEANDSRGNQLCGSCLDGGTFHVAFSQRLLCLLMQFFFLIYIYIYVHLVFDIVYFKLKIALFLFGAMLYFVSLICGCVLWLHYFTHDHWA